jgi:hypothetical protein
LITSKDNVKPNWQSVGVNMMLRPLARALGALAVFSLALAPVGAQTHKVAKPENVVRAVGIYEWTGDMKKPAASRLIPVSLFIDGKLQDAAVYMASPVPMALLTGNVYELQKSGAAQGLLDLAFARHLVAPETATTTYDDGWFGYGKFVTPPPPKKSTLKQSATLAKINGIDENDDEPHFSSRSATPGSGGTATPTAGSTTASTGTPADDPDRPTLHRSSGSGSGDQTASTDSGSAPADDPNRPTLHRSSGSSSGDSTDSTGSASTPADDPDRPTLRRRSPTDAKNASGQSGAGTVDTALNDDPNRPLLHRGKPTGSMTDVDLPKLSGLPGDEDLHQMVAVSDAVNRPPHDFSRAWDDEDEHNAILTKLQAAARAQLTAYEAANAVTPAKPSVKKSTTGTTHRTTKQTPPPPPEALLDEQLTGYTLSYGGAATFVYHAHTDGLGQTLRFVTLVAQINMQGEPEIALKNVTDAAHLDRTPRMRLVDVVDAEASNRASLLFELRAQNSRQFALYRVIGAQATQTFLTGSTP